MSLHLLTDFSKKTLTLIEIVYYSLFMHAFIISFLIIGVIKIYSFNPVLDSFANPLDRIIVLTILKGVLIFIFFFTTYQFIRVYLRLGIQDENIKTATDRKKDLFLNSLYYKKIGKFLDYGLRCLAILFLLNIERNLFLIRDDFCNNQNICFFLSKWSYDILKLYGVLILYTFSINLPCYIISKNHKFKSQALGWAITDIVMTGSWVIINFLLPYSEKSGSQLLTIVFLISCFIFFIIALCLEIKMPLIEPTLEYLKQYSYMKSLAVILLLLIIAEITSPYFGIGKFW